MLCPGVQQKQAQGMLTRQFLANASGHRRGLVSSMMHPDCQDFPIPLPTTLLSWSRGEFSLHHGDAMATCVFHLFTLPKNTSGPPTVCMSQRKGRTLQKADRVSVFTTNHVSTPSLTELV